jgi:hypothetical protein
MTAAGIEAETVKPTRSPRYTLAAPKTSPSKDARDDGAKGEFFGRQIACAERRQPSRFPRGRVSHPVLSFGPF